jgi:hypothetical protein
LKLYYSRNLNPRVAVAVARHLPVEGYPRILAWHERLRRIAAWENPFEGLV